MTGNGLPSGYQLRQLGESYYVTTSHAILEFSRLVDHRDGLAAEVVATDTATGEQHWSRLTLAGPRARAELAKRLGEAAQGIAWTAMLDIACRAVAEAHRRGTPSVALAGDPPADQARWLVEGLVPLRAATILYGDGGAGKSITALALGLAGLRGLALGGSPVWRVRPINSVLYLDWEADQLATWRRLRALCRAEGVEIPSGYRYLRMDRPLTEALSGVSRECAEHSADVVIVDSWAMACGVKPEDADASTRTMTALRSLDVTAVVVAHVTKAAADSGQPSRVYGSVFSTNLARSTIEATGEQEDGRLRVTYRPAKANDARKLPPSAMTYTFSGPEEAPEIAVEYDNPDLTKLSIPAQIIAALRSGAKDGHALAEELGVSADTVTRTLRRGEGRTFTRTEGGHDGGRGNKVLWGLMEQLGHNAPA